MTRLEELSLALVIARRAVLRGATPERITALGKAEWDLYTHVCETEGLRLDLTVPEEAA